ncbi:MAG: outer membrane protein assembly factor BamD [Bacteroidales bacterium]|nr:outer membrane protein assembly factor BamD [Bacteroidales bacterium]MCL2738007.1 outer membrane protein assembly factor BamD [Bacteroidales bacterium]
MNRYFLLLVILLAGCASQYELLLRSPDADLKYQKAFEFYNAGKYNRAKELFGQIVLINRGTARDDSVQYYLGLSQYYGGYYDEAESTFDQFSQIFPRSPFTPKARYLRIECLYGMTYRWELDQLPTYTAISVINEFLYDYPDSEFAEDCWKKLDELNERIEKKSFESAKLYYRIENYRAAAFALRNVLRDNPDNRYREEIMYYIVAANFRYAINSVSFRQRERFLTVIDSYYNFVSEYPESKYIGEVDGMFRRAQRAIGRDREPEVVE